MMQELFDELGYKFQNDSLLYRALTHKSASSDNNERLEFLGDAVLNLYVSEKLFNSYPSINEGKLSLFKSNMKNKKFLRIAPKTTYGAPARGATVILVTNKRRHAKTIDAGSGYLCQMEPVAHYGFRKNEIIKNVIINFVQNLKNDKQKHISS